MVARRLGVQGQGMTEKRHMELFWGIEMCNFLIVMVVVTQVYVCVYIILYEV